jgi:hemoglobin
MGKTGAPKTLFERLGGMNAITAVTDEFVNRTTSDARIKHRFFNTDPIELKRLLAEFVCYASGGKCTYSGRDMATAHAGMDLVDEEFTALVEDLAGALDKFKVPAKEKGELLSALGPLKPDMVVSADRLKPIPDAELAKATAVAGKITDKNAAEIMQAAITAGKRGQRSYAEQLFSRVEFIAGAKTVAAAAPVFRTGAPPRITTAVKTMPADTPPQPKSVGSSDADAPDAKPAGGTLKGTLTLGGQPLSAYATVQLFPAKGGKKRTAKTRVIEQRDKTFAPHITAVPVGSTVSFPNFDKIYHNVFSLSKTNPFDLGLYKSGEMREVTFKKAGIVRLGCNIHANMSAYIVVVDAPHYAVVEGDGNFEFKSLAPGKYKVQAWSEKSAEPMQSEITIKAGENTVTLDLKGGAKEGPSEDKFGASRSAQK